MLDDLASMLGFYEPMRGGQAAFRSALYVLAQWLSRRQQKTPPGHIVRCEPVGVSGGCGNSGGRRPAHQNGPSSRL
jgi:hypothetical protein